MNAMSKGVPFNGFVKVVLGLIAFIYLFGIFWYPSIKCATLDIIFILGLCFRFSFVINNELPKWKIITSLFFYIVVFFDQVYGVVLAT